MLAVTAAALLRTDTWTCRTAAVAWLAFGLPHAWYHAHHVDVFATGSAIANMVVLVVGLVLPAILLRPVSHVRPSLAPVSGR